MEFGVQVNVYRTDWPAVRASVEAMEAGDWDSVWFADHFIPPGGGGDDAQEAMTAFEGLAAIAMAAGMTRKLRLGNLVLGNTYRNPAHTAKIAGTIDTMSEGRFTLALGAGWYKREHEAYGWEFPSMKERQDRFEESCELIRRLIREKDPVDFEGKYYKLDHAQLSPGNFDDSKPIPIMVGGTGPKRTLRTLARYGDVMNLDGWAGSGMSLELYQSKAAILEQHCNDCGRDPAEIRRTLLMPCYLTEDQGLIDRVVTNLGPGTVAGSRQYIIDRIGEFQDAGIAEIMFGGIG
jgi:alkanesulfonate monooxygenase SsuD/methylene tetrahydromethanopterin reductase-like flavin-dependent oxidoreductase (luciferase family)